MKTFNQHPRPIAVALPQPARTNLLPGLILMIVLLVYSMIASAQSITEIITDYKGFWKSSTTAINAVKPDNSHNLLSFSYSGVRYSTGVNDAELTTRGESFVAGDYRALPVFNISGNMNPNTKIGLGAIYDGISNGPTFPAPSRSLPQYLTDGAKGLDLGTCVANLPSGNLIFGVNTIRASSIADGIPDLLITQIADPSNSSLDSYEFTDINGVRVGNSVDIVLNNLNVVGNWTADFYEASLNPMTLIPGFTQTDRPVRLWAADFSAFGINAGNINQIAFFKVRLNGNSDVAFVAYNANAVDIQTALPSTLSSFNGKATNGQVQLNWKTVTEVNTSEFIIEAGTDGKNFSVIGKVNASGNSNTARDYVFVDRNPSKGSSYYRLKTMDLDGRSEYSRVIEINLDKSGFSMNLYPNPATSQVIITHESMTGDEQLVVRNMQGILVMMKKPVKGSIQTIVTLNSFSKGIYQVSLLNGKENLSKTLLVQ